MTAPVQHPTPVERAREALLDHHHLSNEAVAALAGCGEMTVCRQRHLMHAEGLIPAPRPRGGGWPVTASRARRLAIVNPGLSSYQLAELAETSPSYAWRTQDDLRRRPPLVREQAEAWAETYPDATVPELAELSGINKANFAGLRSPGGKRPEEPFRLPRLFWRADQGLCSEPGRDPEDWTGTNPAGQKRALAVCAGCPVREDCLAWAMQLPAHLDHYIWGGTTAPQRTRLRLQWRAERQRLSQPA